MSGRKATSGDISPPTSNCGVAKGATWDARVSFRRAHFGLKRDRSARRLRAHPISSFVGGRSSMSPISWARYFRSRTDLEHSDGSLVRQLRSGVRPREGRNTACWVVRPAEIFPKQVSLENWSRGARTQEHARAGILLGELAGASRGIVRSAGLPDWARSAPQRKVGLQRTDSASIRGRPELRRSTLTPAPYPSGIAICCDRLREGNPAFMSVMRKRKNPVNAKTHPSRARRVSGGRR